MQIINYISKLLDNAGLLKKIFIATLFITNIFYAGYIFLLGFYNRLAADDYCYLNEFQKYGFQSPLVLYREWQGRFSAQTLINVVLKSYEYFHTLLPYTVLLYIFYIYVFQKMLLIFLEKHVLKSTFSAFFLLNIAVFFLHIFIAANFAFHTFFWLNVSVMYFGGVAFALLGLTEILSRSRKIISYILLIISALFVGASAEHFSAICIMLLGFGILFQFRKHKFLVLHIPVFQKILLAFIVISIAFIIMILAPGNNIRRAYFPETTVLQSFVIAAQSLGILLLYYIPAKLKFLLIIAFAGLYIGNISAKKPNKKPLKNLAAKVLLLLPVFIFFLWICLLPNAYAQGNMGPMRAHTHTAFYFVSMAFFLAFLIGFHIRFPEKMLSVAAIVGVFFFFANSLFSLRYTLPEAIAYSQSEDKRLKILQTKKAANFSGTLVLDSLYHPKKNLLQTEPVLYINEIAAAKDSAEMWKNRCLCGGLQLPFQIELRK